MGEIKVCAPNISFLQKQGNLLSINNSAKKKRFSSIIDSLSKRYNIKSTDNLEKN